MASTDESISKLNRDIKRLDEKTRKTDKKVDELEDSIAFNEEDISDLKKNAKATELELEKWRKEVLYLEASSRRENVNFLASRRTRRAVRATLALIPRTQKVLLQLHGTRAEERQIARDRITFQRIHRLGKPKTNGSRPIIARFLRYFDKEEA